MVARAQLLRFVVSLINLNDSVSFLEIRESKSKDGNQILCHSQVFYCEFSSSDFMCYIRGTLFN